MTGIKGFFAVIGEATRNLFRPNVTVLFPLEHTALPEGFRGAPEVDSDLCIICRRCERECPSHAIRITPTESPDTPPGMEAFAHSIELARCMFCQTCEEFCSVGRRTGTPAIALGKQWLLANYTTEATIVTKIVYKKKREKESS
ncbi:MAG: 4Fe-4S binding protein [Candidatus Hodarchaeales archaeon]